MADVDQQARERPEIIIRQMAQGISEALKATDPMARVGRMNNIRACAAEIVNAEIIFV